MRPLHSAAGKAFGLRGRLATHGIAVQSAGGPVQVVALAVDPARPPRCRFREGSAAGVCEGDAVIVSGLYANRHGTRAGATVRRTDRGEKDFRLAGVFCNYGSSAGVVVMSRCTYDRAWDDRTWLGCFPRARRCASTRRRRISSFTIVALLRLW